MTAHPHLVIMEEPVLMKSMAFHVLVMWDLQGIPVVLVRYIDI